MIRGGARPIATLVSTGLLCPFLISCSLSTSCSGSQPAATQAAASTAAPAAAPAAKAKEAAVKSPRKPDKLDKLLAETKGTFPGRAGGGPVAHGGSGPPAMAPGAKPVAGSPTQAGPITVIGTARNAAMGAVVVRDDGRVWYVDKLSEWDDKLLGKKVKVSGVVQVRKLAPDPTVGPDGAVSHGMVGTSTILANAKWTLQR